MNTYLMFFLAPRPIIILIIGLGALKIPAHKICPIALIITIILSILSWKMPIKDSLTAALEGVALGIWPIMIVIIAAVFTYNLVVHTKAMEIIKSMLTDVSDDKRILVLILAWGFGGFLEAVAGFGTAVAIPVGIMAALGFNPFFAAVICLVANTTPTAFGAIGLPVITLSNVSGVPIEPLSYYVVIQLFLFVVLIPFILVALTEKSLKGIKGVLGITLASGLSFGIVQVLVAKFLGPELPAVLGSIVSLLVTIFIAKKFYKKSEDLKNEEKIELKKVLTAFSPFILILVIIIGVSPLFPSLYDKLNQVKTSVNIYTGVGAKPYTFVWLTTPGVLILIAAFIGGFIQRASFKEMVEILGKTMMQMSKSAITILSIIALAKVMGYSGMVASIATVLVMVTGSFYAFIAPFIGALGTFVTGSDTSANVLFGELQAQAANSLGISPAWLTAANTCGATAGKMISPQSIAVATAATGLAGKEGKILNATLKVCIVYVILLGVISYLGSLIFT
ncbi:L-lactate permease [Clostridium perfringens]|nr:L-lactate permease [Clostridium perfringens]